MSQSSSDPEATRAYYDEFSRRYERHRRPEDPQGYHALLDDLEVSVTERYARSKDLLECGCGTGLLLERFARFARSAKGIDLSPGMLVSARARGLDVYEGSVTSLPFSDESFDVTCSFKVLAHVPDIGRALAEMVRVTRRGGVVLAEFYNPWSLRGAAKVFGPAGRISGGLRENAVYTRFDPPWRIPKLLPAGAALERGYGVRVFTPVALAMKVPGLRQLLRAAETRALDSPLRLFAGFYIAAIRRQRE